jgi:acetolactate synthase small subunit
MESLLDEEEVLSRQTGITAEKGYNFWSDRWIALNVLHEFSNAVVVVPPMESLVVQHHILWRHTRITAKTCHNF